MTKKLFSITYGTFDAFHKGHFNLLKRCITNDDTMLIVGVASDDYVARKNKKSLFTERERVRSIEICPFVYKVILEENLEQWIIDYKKYKITSIFMGSDHIGELDYFINDYNMNLIYLSRTTGVSTTDIKKDLAKTGSAFYFLDVNKKSEWPNLFSQTPDTIDMKKIVALKDNQKDIDLFLATKDLYEKYNIDIVFVADKLVTMKEYEERLNVKISIIQK